MSPVRPWYSGFPGHHGLAAFAILAWAARPKRKDALRMDILHGLYEVNR